MYKLKSGLQSMYKPRTCMSTTLSTADQAALSSSPKVQACDFPCHTDVHAPAESSTLSGGTCCNEATNSEVETIIRSLHIDLRLFSPPRIGYHLSAWARLLLSPSLWVDRSWPCRGLWAEPARHFEQQQQSDLQRRVRTG